MATICQHIADVDLGLWMSTCVDKFDNTAAGDWEGVGRLVTKQRSGATYDLVLSSETLYNLESQEILLNCLTQVGRYSQPLSCHFKGRHRLLHWNADSTCLPQHALLRMNPLF